MDYVNSQVLQGLNFLQTAKGIVFLNFKEYCRHNLKSAEEDGLCRNGSNDDHPPFNRDNVLFNWPSNDNIMHLFLRDFDLKKELYSNSFNKIMLTPISTDHTFKVSKNIGFARKVEGKLVKQFENCSIALSDSGEVMTWCLTRLTALAEIKDFLSGLKQRLDRIMGNWRTYTLMTVVVFVRNMSVFGSVKVLLNLFHACRRITSAANKRSALYAQFCRVWIDF